MQTPCYLTSAHPTGMVLPQPAARGSLREAGIPIGSPQAPGCAVGYPGEHPHPKPTTQNGSSPVQGCRGDRLEAHGSGMQALDRTQPHGSPRPTRRPPRCIRGAL